MIGFNKLLLRIIYSLILLTVSSFSSEIVELTDTTFDDVIQTSTGTTTTSDDCWFVLFKAEQCGLCKKVRPVFQKLSEDESIPDNIKFAIMDVPRNRRTSARFDIHGFPIFLYFCQDNEVYYKFKGKRKFE